MDGGAVGAPTTHIDDILGCGERGVPSRLQTFLGSRLGEWELQESSFVHLGMDLRQASDYSVRSTKADFSSKLVLSESSPALWAARQQAAALWAARQQLLSPGDVLRCP